MDKQEIREAIHADLMFLAGELPHRSAQTVNERRAAEFIQRRFLRHTPHASIEDFHAIENYGLLFASYYVEFVIVAAVAWYWPALSAVYGAVVFGSYLAEFLGYRLWARFLPEYETQNVVAQFLAPEPRMTIIVNAHYDSGCANLLSHPDMVPLLRPVHFLLLACMVLIIATGAVEALQPGLESVVIPVLRWSAVAVLALVGIVLAVAGGRGEDIRGANTNASGVAALLRLAQMLGEQQPQNADVWLLATGSHESWMSGVRHFLGAHKPDRRTTCIINLESVGAGKLFYLTGEGMLQRFRPGKRLLNAARGAAHALEVREGHLHAIPTAAHIPHARGYQTITLAGLEPTGLPANWNWVTDRVTEVEENTIAHAADFTHSLITRLAQDP